MNKKICLKIVITLLLVTILFSVLSTCVYAFGDIYSTNINTSLSLSQKNTFINNTTRINVKIENMSEKEKTYLKGCIDKFKSVDTADKAATVAMKAMMEIVEDPDNVNWKNVGVDAAVGIVNLAASCFGFGGVAEAITGPLSEFIKDKDPTEIDKLKEYLDEQFAIVSDGIDTIRKDINNISVRMDESLNEAIDELKEYITAELAGEKVFRFTTSGEGNFSYSTFKNYIFGVQEEGNILSRYAYYDKLTKAITFGADDRVVEEYYNSLYNSLMTLDNEREPYIYKLREYMLEDQTGYSIQRYYYDWVSSHRTELEVDPEWEAIMFTLDLYKTLLSAESCLADCYNYFLFKIYEEYGTKPSDYDVYNYVNPDGTTTNEKYADIIIEQSTLYNENYKNEIVIQLIKDIAYILNMGNSYMLEDSNGEIYCIDNSKDFFGNLPSGSKIYLNKLSDEICEMFGLDPQLFTYNLRGVGDALSGDNSSFIVPNNVSEIKISLMYNGTEIYNMGSFSVDSPESFNGGNGTKENPYLISDAAQFKLIKTGKDENGINYKEYYKLISDIDFENNTVAPIGGENDFFAGSLDGHGFSIKNIKISGASYTGLFSKIGENGVVKNLTIENMNLAYTTSESYTIEAGAIAGRNEGTITNCHIRNSSLEIIKNTSSGGTVTFLGGIAGTCYGSSPKIEYCSVYSTDISCESYTSGKNSSNDPNVVYVGGITGFFYDVGTKISNCVVDGEGRILAQAKSTYDGFPYVYTWVGGISFYSGPLVTFDNNLANVYVGSSVKIYSKASAIKGEREKNCANFSYRVCRVPENYEMAKREDIQFPQVGNDYDITYSYNEGVLENQTYKYNDNFLTTHIVYRTYECTSKNCNWAYNEMSGKIKFEELEDDFVCPECGAKKSCLIENYSLRKYEKILKLKVNGGELTEYKIIGYYGFDTIGSNKSENKSSTVTIVFEAELNGENKIVSVNIPITVEGIKQSELIIESLPKTEYDKDEVLSLEGGDFYVLWEDGTRNKIIPTIVSGKTDVYGRSYVVISYNDLVCTYAIHVKCIHEDSANYYEELQVPPTCISEGYTQMICVECGDRYTIEESIVEKIDHTTEIVNKKDATCFEPGYTGDVYCTSCNDIIEYGKNLELTSHIYEDDIKNNECKCSVCGHNKKHGYTSVENYKEIIYSCKDCNHKEVVSIVANSDMPMVVVGNSYGVVGNDDEIIVYVKVFNNPGFAGVSFAIEYDERLQYVRYEIGDLLINYNSESIIMDDVKGVVSLTATSYGIYEDGNLLKLIFKLPDDAKEMDKYNVSIVYEREQMVDGKAEIIDIVTMEGCVTAVMHLPGDVNGDGCVDIFDTTLVARYVTISRIPNSTLILNQFLEEQGENFDIFYADVNLDGTVGLADLVIMRQYFIGLNQQEFTSNKYDVILNTNDGSIELEKITVEFYIDYDNGIKGTYNNLPVLSREGYRFDGWYTGFDIDGDGVKKVESGDFVYYNPTYLKQVLYAHWTEIYTVEYNVNTPECSADVIGSMEASIFEYGVQHSLAENKYKIEGWQFKGWSTSPNGAVQYADGQKVDNLANARESVVLYAIWEPYSYTVKFNPNKPIKASNNIVGSMGEITNCIYDNDFILSENMFTLKGWTFTGWNTKADGTGDHYGDCASVKNLTNVNDGTAILYAQWRQNTYTVMYYQSMYVGYDSQYKSVHLYDEESALLDNMFDIPYEGCHFGGWTRTLDKETIYENKALVSNLTDEDGGIVKIFALWPSNEYKVEYNANGGTGTMTPSDHICQDAISKLKSNVFTRTGYTFVGWNTKPDGTGTSYSDGQVASPALTTVHNDTVTLYAQWIATPTVTFDANGGSVNQSTKVVTYKNTYGDLPIPTRTDYIFVGWTYNSSVITSESEVVTAVDHTLIAQWVKVNSSVVLGSQNVDRHTIRIWNSWGHDDDWCGTDTINPGMNRDQLKSNGYTKIKVSMTFQYRVDDWGDQSIQIFSNTDKEIEKFVYEWGECGWQSKTVTYEINLDDTDVYCGFWIKWYLSKDGANSDTWFVGKTTLKIEAIK